MMIGVPLETWWAFNKRWNNKFYYKATFGLYFHWVIYDAQIHEYQISLIVCPLRLSHVFPQSNNITDLGQKMTLPVQFHIPLVFLDLPIGKFKNIAIR